MTTQESSFRRGIEEKELELTAISDSAVGQVKISLFSRTVCREASGHAAIFADKCSLQTKICEATSVEVTSYACPRKVRVIGACPLGVCVSFDMLIVPGLPI